VGRIKKIRERILKFVISKNAYESMAHANKIVLFFTIPYLLAASVINMVVFPLLGDIGLKETLINSLILLLFAAVFWGVGKFAASEYVKYNAFNITAGAILIFIVVRYYAHIGPAVWTAAFTIIVISLLRNNWRMLASTGVAIVLSGLYIWTGHRQYTGGLQYDIIQVAAFVFMFAAGAGVLYINVAKYQKIRLFLNESEILRLISSDFISVSPENLKEKVDHMLELSSKYYNVDKAVVLLTSEDRRKLDYAYEWCADSKDSSLGSAGDFQIDSRPEWIDQMENRTVWIIPNVDEAADELLGIAELKAMHIKAMISAPIIVNDRVLGILFYMALNGSKKWEDEHRRLLVVLTNLLAEALNKVETEKEINHMAYYDTLTGLPNRYLFNNYLNLAISEAAAVGRRFAVIFIDLDSFKSVNDTTGHEGGDELLKQTALRLRECAGAAGIVARFGGDEFIVMLPRAGDRLSIVRMADIVMGAFKKPIVVNNQEFFITASAGIAVYPEDGGDSSTLKKNADLAMYAAKELGKNQAAFCTCQLKEDVQYKVQLTNMLYRALRNNEFVLHYQPQVDLSTNEIIGVEALIRWNNPEFGLIPPGVFIPLAEQTGLINPIGKWVAETACLQNMAWQEAGFKPFRMAVNLSVEQFHHPDLVETIKGALEKSGLAPRYLELEITESIAIKQTNDISTTLEKLKTLGVLISIDDFGTAYSSLSRIKQLPIDRIKMAMEFVHGISVSEKDEAIAKIIINLAANLGLKVIAEGVETEFQYEFLKSRVCNEVQGFYFYKPMPAADVEALLLETAALKPDKPALAVI
jgi:diguanylate cyclase (GGDEF)-like protein